MKKVYIVGAKRTAIGSFLGSLKDQTVPTLAATAIQGAIKQANINPSSIDEVVLGNVLSAGLGQGVARQAVLSAHLDQSIPAYSLNMVCGSGLKAVVNGAAAIQCGQAQSVIAAGAESMSRAPFIMNSRVRSGQKMGDLSLVDSMVHDGLTDAFEGYHMGITAENIATEYTISREAQDAFAVESQRKAINARDKGYFDQEIVPVSIKTREGLKAFQKDEYINEGTTLEKMNRLRTVFKPDGTVTAANASGLNDGASAIVLASQEIVEQQQLRPLAEIVAVGHAGIDPSIMGMGPVPAIKQALDHAGLSLADIDLFELNEAFAAQSIAVIRTLASECGIDEQTLLNKTNVHGGAIALGHPIGASGNRVLVTLIHALKQRQEQYGIASLCIGGGMGIAVIIKSCS